MKKHRKIIAILMVSAMLIALLPVLASSASAPVPGQPAWDSKYAAAKVIAPALGPASDIPNNPRNNATGDKITSNAHSADFPGLYFYWNDKQKDNGVLLVEEWVFDLFVDGKFILTAKNSNNYWGYKITPDAGQLIGGVYAYGISKQIKYNETDNKGKLVAKTDDLKNINMVFIDGEYKTASFIIEKFWYDVKGALVADDAVIAELNELLSFNNGAYTLGINEVQITDYMSAAKGKKITVTEAPIEGYFPVEGTSASYTITVKYNDDPIKVVTFRNQKIKKIWTGEINLKKLVEGKLFAEWKTDYAGDINELIAGMNFYLYAVSGNKAIIDDLDDYLAIGKINQDSGYVEFLDGNGNALEFPAGWYAVIEKLEGIAAEVFEAPDPAIFYFRLGETSIDDDEVTNSLFLISGIGGNVGEVVINDDLYSSEALQDVWTNNLGNIALYNELATIAVKYNVELAWVWESEVADNNAHSYTWIAIDEEFYLGEEIMVDEDGEVKIYFAADDAVVVRINGEVAAYSTAQLKNNGDGTFSFNYPFGAYQGVVGGFAIYCADVLDYLKPNAQNSIKIEVMNQDAPPVGEGVVDGNPSGLLLFIEVCYKDPAINNKLKPFTANIDVLKLVDGDNITAWISAKNIADINDYITFELYKAFANLDGYDDSAAPIGVGYVNPLTGKIEFVDGDDEALKVPAGCYAIVELLSVEGAKMFRNAEPLFFEVTDKDFEGEFENVSIPDDPKYEYPKIDKIPSDSHIARWFDAYGIYCLAGNTTYGNNNYFIVFDANKFDFDKYAEVTIRYGNKLADTRNEHTFSTDGDYETISYDGKDYYGVVYEFIVFDSGSMHAYLYSLLLK